MKNINHIIPKISFAVSVLIISGCANQNKIAQQQLQPVINPCQKIDYLIKAYDDNFDQLKHTKIKASASNIWQAKYHLIGKSCRIWTWGGNQTTYSCNTVEVNEGDAQNYYNNAKETLHQCLGEDWKLVESKRNHDDGIKAEFSSDKEEVAISTHLVPNSGIFKSKWSVYYYIGKME